MNELVRILRARKLGVLLRDARSAAGKSIAECAHVVGVSEAAFALYEDGEQSPSLPELEVLADYLDVSLEHFWGNTAISEMPSEKENVDYPELIGLRQRIIGVLISQDRETAGMSLEEVAGRVGCLPEELRDYELGEAPVPLPVLEALGAVFGRPVKEFRDQAGRLGVRAARQARLDDFGRLPVELQAFICKPVNQPYLELAQRLSNMSVDRLRSVAEGLLEITL